MKFQPRQFVVEVKRGTNRQAFLSHENESRFSKAEALLFSRPEQAEPENALSGAMAKPGGRILQALAEPEPIVMVDPIPTRRRGRPVGSKNKPKQIAMASSPAIRTPEAVGLLADPGGAAEIDPAPIETTVDSQQEALIVPVEPAPASRRPARLRDRSRILQRYVFGTEQKAGDRTWRRARRMKRTGGDDRN